MDVVECMVPKTSHLPATPLHAPTGYTTSARCVKPSDAPSPDEIKGFRDPQLVGQTAAGIPPEVSWPARWGREPVWGLEPKPDYVQAAKGYREWTAALGTIPAAERFTEQPGPHGQYLPASPLTGTFLKIGVVRFILHNLQLTFTAHQRIKTGAILASGPPQEKRL